MSKLAGFGDTLLKMNDAQRKVDTLLIEEDALVRYVPRGFLVYKLLSVAVV
jgi:hypothetical protein